MRGLPAVWLLLIAVAVPVAADAPVVRLVEYETVVHPVSAKRILKAIDDAEAAGDELVLIQIDTPGGLVVSMEQIVKRMLAAEVPVVVWVGPAGARAASAGFFILIASDVAAMAPGTRTGAAAAVDLSGDNNAEDFLFKKANEDVAAMIRSIAQRRGRNVEASEQAVFSAKAYEETVALEKGLIDLIAASREELLEQLDGRQVRRFDDSVVTLRTAGATFVVSEFSIQQEFMELLAVPWVAAFLLLVGIGGIYVELTHPGVVLPGVVGALCLLLFALAAQALPVSTIGILLIALALVMFILEIKVTSYGMLTVGGAIALVVGSLMLIDGPIPELRVPPAVVLPTSILIVLLMSVVLRLAIKAQRSRVATGVEGMTAKIGTVTEALEPEGKVFVHGEIWDAASTSGTIPQGTQVRVVGVENMRLTVEPAESPNR